MAKETFNLSLDKYIIVDQDEKSISTDFTGCSWFETMSIDSLEDETKNIYNEYPKLYSLKGAQTVLRKYPGYKMKKVKVTYESEE